MMRSPQGRPGFWETVRLLLGAARKRSHGRKTRQQQLLNNRTGKQATDFRVLGLVLAVVFMAVIHGMAATSVAIAVYSGEGIDAESRDPIVVSNVFLMEAQTAEAGDDPMRRQRREAFYRAICSSEARSIANKTGGRQAQIEARLLDSLHRYGTAHLTTQTRPAWNLVKERSNQPVAALAGSVILLLWFIMMVFQGEGLELDLQRRRHPMWEWLFSHPAPPGAIFLAEMLSPLAVNPVYWGAPVFAGILYGLVYGPALGLLATLVVGVPIAVAAACLGKALEIGVVLRFAPRTRGAMVGLMSWTGYASMMLFLLGFSVLPKLMPAMQALLLPLAKLPWPWLALFLGGPFHGAFSFPLGVAACWSAAALTLAASVWFSVWATNQGLAGNFAAIDSRPARLASGQTHFARYPLYRKEMLWFLRDRSAVVQTILIPVTIAGVQMFNLRGLLLHAQRDWSYLSGAGIFFGTYFLWILGPKSLASEGNALWIALTWPTGLESLLKAKAWLWSLISSAMVAVVLCYAVYLFPAAYWKIALVAVAWYVFGRTMAEKAVTLVTVTSESGETQKIPQGRRWAAQLGMLTFAIGIISGQWHVAVMGIVYSWITAAAMWQNFRARLPFLFDPWSETLPPPPTLMHAMVSISILVEAGAVVTGILTAALGRDHVGVAIALGYAICAVIVSLSVSNFLVNRGVLPQEVWTWRAVPPEESDAEPWWRIVGFRDPLFFRSLLAGVGGGVLLGLAGRGYLAILMHLPVTAELIHKSQQQMAAIPGLRVSYFVIAVLFAPFAEEYLFRGLLFRALDREWGGWRAIVGSAAFFAVYHPALSWPPVFLLGAANALLFKRSGRLWPAILLHMAYNAVVLSGRA